MPRGSFVSRPADFGQPVDARVDQFATWSMSENLRSLTLLTRRTPIVSPADLVVRVLYAIERVEVADNLWSL